jgi:succinate dehydrogenase / fumarate reductase iron-sulfur subunit
VSILLKKKLASLLLLLSEFKKLQKMLTVSTILLLIKCGLYYSVCPTVTIDTQFPRPQALAQPYRYYADTRDKASKDRLNTVDDRYNVEVSFCWLFTTICPKGVHPALGIQLPRGHILIFKE